MSFEAESLQSELYWLSSTYACIRAWEEKKRIPEYRDLCDRFNKQHSSITKEEIISTAKKCSRLLTSHYIGREFTSDLKRRNREELNFLEIVSGTGSIPIIEIDNDNRQESLEKLSCDSNLSFELRDFLRVINILYISNVKEYYDKFKDYVLVGTNYDSQVIKDRDRELSILKSILTEYPEYFKKHTDGYLQSYVECDGIE
jgi:hypothetical protein